MTIMTNQYITGLDKYKGLFKYDSMNQSGYQFTLFRKQFITISNS